MKLPVLSGFALLCTAAAFAQTPSSTQQPPGATQAITMTGCVGGGANSQPYVLNNALVLPGTGSAAAPGAIPPAGTAATPPVAGTPATPPAAGTAATPPVAGTAAPGAPPAAVPVTPIMPPATPPPTAAGAAPQPGAATPATGAGGTGTVGTTGAPGTVGTAGAPAAGTTAGTGGPGMNGYRLSGTDMSSWAGQRVQIVGTVIPSNAPASATPGAVPMPEFRVQSVQPVAGSCPQR